MIHKKISFFIALLLLGTIVCCCGTPIDPAAVFFEYMEFHFYDLAVEEGWYDPEQLERTRSIYSWYRDESGALYQRIMLFDEPTDVCLSRDIEVPLDISKTYAADVVDLPDALGVRYKVYNLSSEELSMPRFFVWDVLINGNWYLLYETNEANIRNHNDPLLMPSEHLDKVAPGKSQEQTIWDRWHNTALLSGHYRICLSHDGVKWVVVEFDIPDSTLED